MRHIEEHILELHVLGSEKVADRREEILAHLGECHGCRHLAEQMAEFYRETETELKNLSSVETRPQTSLVRSHRDLQKLYEPTAPAIPLRTPTRIERFGIFVRMHPVATIGGSFSFLAALGLLIGLNLNPVIGDRIPSKLHFDTKGGKLQVFNKSEQLLWEKPSNALGSATTGEALEGLRRTTRISDLNHDGRPLVVTSMDFFNYSTERSNVLQVIDGDGKTVWSRSFSREVPNLRNRVYGSAFHANEVIVWENEGRANEIVVSLSNLGRSPGLVLRLDNHGKELGAYWHFGYLGLFGTRMFEGRRMIVAAGTNDMNDTTRGEFPVLVLLDPARITEQEGATATPIYPFPTSDAEQMYIRFPHSDMNDILQSMPFPVQCIEHSNNSLFVHVGTGNPGQPPHFVYVFDGAMQVVEVKSDNATDRLHEELRLQGKLTSTLDRAYLENLRQGVRYWDGKKWRKEVVRVKHDKAEGN